MWIFGTISVFSSLFSEECHFEWCCNETPSENHLILARNYEVWYFEELILHKYNEPHSVFFIAQKRQ